MIFLWIKLGPIKTSFNIRSNVYHFFLRVLVLSTFVASVYSVHAANFLSSHLRKNASKVKNNRILTNDQMSKLSALQLAKLAFEQKLYFTSAEYMKVHLLKNENLSSSGVELLDSIIVKTNIFPFLDMPIEVLVSVNYSQHLAFVIGKKYFFKRDYPSAALHFKSVKKGSFFYLPAIHHLAGIYQILGDDVQSLLAIEECFKASSVKVNYKQEVFKSRNEFIYDNCEHFKARHYYKFGNMEKSQLYFKKIPINSYIFPQSLMESSWVYFRNNDIRRAIGKNLSYQSPLFVDYFIPEAELVKTLSYIQLCQYEEAMGVIRHFDQEVKSKVINFAKEFNLEQKESYQFARLFTDPYLKNKLGDSFFSRQLRVIWTRPGFQSIKYYMERINLEKKKVDSLGIKLHRQAFARSYRNFIEFFNDFVKLKLIQMAKSIIKINNYFNDMELDLYSEIKNQLYDEKNNKKVEKNGKFKLAKVEQKADQYYFEFKREFWADEIPGYVLVIDNKCSTTNVYEKAIKNFQ